VLHQIFFPVTDNLKSSIFHKKYEGQMGVWDVQKKSLEAERKIKAGEEVSIQQQHIQLVLWQHFHRIKPVFFS
jgi:hypothetical protein